MVGAGAAPAHPRRSGVPRSPLLKLLRARCSRLSCPRPPAAADANRPSNAEVS
ncbi:Hypothetical protein CAP_8156 [Chondromyces apiculatus DSM 436]|uniref:Uncharacterized protein n=1 Tax=Chondromyces apiculatus DSM 436 TaxID=1192034 RepID=A0A017TFQ5_9BACT|nr:Hypothetical protein CAP_8156 [Chondromyces apiculatus DSM 436]